MNIVIPIPGTSPVHHSIIQQQLDCGTFQATILRTPVPGEGGWKSTYKVTFTNNAAAEFTEPDMDVAIGRASEALERAERRRMMHARLKSELDRHEQENP